MFQPRYIKQSHLLIRHAEKLIRYRRDRLSESTIAELRAQGGETTEAEAARAKATPAALPPRISPESLQGRLNPPETVLLTCGNPAGMADIQKAAEARGIQFEKEDW